MKLFLKILLEICKFAIGGFVVLVFFTIVNKDFFVTTEQVITVSKGIVGVLLLILLGFIVASKFAISVLYEKQYNLLKKFSPVEPEQLVVVWKSFETTFSKYMLVIGGLTGFILVVEFFTSK